MELGKKVCEKSSKELGNTKRKRSSKALAKSMEAKWEYAREVARN